MQATHLLGIMSAHGMLAALEEAYKPQGKKRGYLAFTSLLSLHWGADQRAAQFVAAFRKAVRDMTEAGGTRDADLLVCTLLF